MTKFQRYAGAEDAPLNIFMPAPSITAQVLNTTISEVIGMFEASQHVDLAKQYPWADRFVMGMPLPCWQRPAAWTREQQLRFITSIWEGLDLGSYLANDLAEYSAPGEFREFSDALLDGQQRLFAIECYLLGKFAVPDALGKPRLWGELSRVERRRFSNFHFARATVRSWDETFLRKAYDLRAFGGTPHLPSQRASLER